MAGGYCFPLVARGLFTSVKWCRGGQQSHCISSIFEILSQKWYHWVQYIKPTYTLLAWFFFWPRLVYLSMLFILERACTAQSAGQLKNKWHAQKSQPFWKWCYSVKLGSYVGSYCTEYNGTTFETISQTLKKWGKFFVHCSNTWWAYSGSASMCPRHNFTTSLSFSFLSLMITCHHISHCLFQA